MTPARQSGSLDHLSLEQPAALLASREQALREASDEVARFFSLSLDMLATAQGPIPRA
jgi:hypothetical protein